MDCVRFSGKPHEALVVPMRKVCTDLLVVVIVQNEEFILMAYAYMNPIAYVAAQNNVYNKLT